MPEKRKAEVILTKEDGTQLVYHTNRRDALHQMLLGVGVLSTDRWGVGAQPCHTLVAYSMHLPEQLSWSSTTVPNHVSTPSISLILTQ